MLDHPEVRVGGGAEGVVDLVAEGGAVAGEAAEPGRDVEGELRGEAPGEGRRVAEADVVAAGLVPLGLGHGVEDDVALKAADPVKVGHDGAGQEATAGEYSVTSTRLKNNYIYIYIYLSTYYTK